MQDAENLKTKRVKFWFSDVSGCGMSGIQISTVARRKIIDIKKKIFKTYQVDLTTSYFCDLTTDFALIFPTVVT